MAYRPYMKKSDGTLSDIPLQAEVANKLGTSNIGSSNTPFYLSGGSPVACNETLKSNSQIVNLIYPVGSIYMSVNSTNPGTLFGGTWEKLKDRFLLGAGDTYSLGATGGEANHTLTTDEMPSHSHSASTSSNGSHTHSVYSTDTWSNNAVGLYHQTKAAGFGGVDQWGGSEWYSTTQSHGEQMLLNNGSHTHTVTVDSAGGGNAHNNMPPYLVVNIWKRTA